MKETFTDIYKDTVSIKTDTTIYNAAVDPPDFPGGMDKFYNYIRSNIKYTGLKGKVFVLFVVEKNGSLTHIKIDHGLTVEEQKETIRLITNSPKWIPGITSNHPVRVRYTLPIVFK